MKIEFTINTTPTAQQRPRHAVRNGFSCTYKSKQQKDNEMTLEALLMPYVPSEPMREALRLEFTAYMPIPKSFSKKQTEKAYNGEIQHTKKPDLDNICKHLLDCMKRMNFFVDDCQIVEVSMKKRYSGWGSYKVKIEEV